MTWTLRVAMTVLVASAAAHATTVDDFRRGTVVTLVKTEAQLHISTFWKDFFIANTATGEVCLNKQSGSLDVAVDLSSFGLPVTVPFVGTLVTANSVRLVANQTINQCLSLGGQAAFVKSISGTLTLHFTALPEPVAGTCAPDLSERFAIIGGGETDTENQLVVEAESDCNNDLGTVDAHIVAHDLKANGLSGRALPPPPLAIASFDSEQTFICPAPSKPLTVPGALQLNQKAPTGGWSFALWSSEPAIPAQPSTLLVSAAQSQAHFSTVVPKGWLGTYTLSTSGQGLFGKHEVTVSNDPNCRVVTVLPPKLPSCLPCLYGERLRWEKPSGIISQSEKGAVYSTAPSLAGVAGYSVVDGAVTGHFIDSGGAVSTFPDVQFIDLNDSGLAVGTMSDPRRGGRPVLLLPGGSLRSLETPSGVGEARWVDAEGNIGGWVASSSGLRQPAIWSAERLRLLPLAEGADGAVVSLDDDGLAAVVFRDASGKTGSYTYDLKSGEKRDLPLPPSTLLDDAVGVEVVGATTLGVAGHYVRRTGERVPFLDFGMGAQLVAPILDARVTVDRLIGLGPAGQLIAHGTLDGQAQDMVLQTQSGVLR